MTATDELQALLTARGVEWKEHRHTLAGSMAIQRETLWGQPTDNASGKPIPHVYHNRATEMGDGRLFLEAQLITPAQAIAATLGDADATPTRHGGAGTCHEVADKLRRWHPHETFDNDHMGEKHIRILYQLLGLGGALMMDGADAAEAVRDRLIQLLGGEDE